MRRHRLRWSDGRAVIGGLRDLKPLWVYGEPGAHPALEAQSRPGARWRPFTGGPRYGGFLADAGAETKLVETAVPRDWADLYERRLSWVELEVSLEVEAGLWPGGPRDLKQAVWEALDALEPAKVKPGEAADISDEAGALCDYLSDQPRLRGVDSSEYFETVEEWLRARHSEVWVRGGAS